ncbi:type-1 angiotensin II receptor-associated protein-like [Centruroides sculpturatus]|uniref:type-1 angiotensin II receptor-associated protein-like n=1 Tax=Centruroides sculpturatus TaxID=218467 RepID=UPI000C6E4B5C|nr:type-1 angiotensin II receptor-associated protein-like [Centruroides sculpturatus]
MINVPNAPLKVVFFLHFLLTTWALQIDWLPPSYGYYNLVFLLLIIWSIHYRDSEEPVFMALVVDVAAIILDMISISIYFNHANSHTMRFAIVMSIANIVIRPISAIILLRIYNERSGRYSTFSIPGLNFGRGPYEDIDNPVPQSVPKTPVDTGSPVRTSPDIHVPPPYAPPQQTGGYQA